MLKERADLVPAGDHRAGVIEPVERLVASDLQELGPALSRRLSPLGTTPERRRAPPRAVRRQPLSTSPDVCKER